MKIAGEPQLKTPPIAHDIIQDIRITMISAASPKVGEPTYIYEQSINPAHLTPSSKAPLFYGD